MAHDFTPDPTLEVWTSIHVEYACGAKRRGASFVCAIGRLKDGVGLAEAQTELDGILARLEKVYPEENRNLRASLVPLHQYVVEGVRPLLLVLLGAVGIVLLIACTHFCPTEKRTRAVDG